MASHGNNETVMRSIEGGESFTMLTQTSIARLRAYTEGIICQRWSRIIVGGSRRGGGDCVLK